MLIIDDDEDDFLIARDMLKEARGRKFDIHWANTFAAGRDELISNHYHAVLVDYDLGSHSGIELIREANERGHAAPLILFTGRGSYEVDVEAMEAGATMYLTKGEVNPLLLERAIRYAIEIKQRENELREHEAALRRMDSRWNAAIESINVGVIIATEDEQVIYWNPAAQGMHGFTRPDEGIEPLEETPITFQLWTPDGSHLLELDEWPMRRIKRGETVRDLELLIRRPDQDWEKIFSYSGVMVDTTGGERLIFLTCLDITEQRRMEGALRVSEERLRSALDAARMVAWEYDPATLKVSFSENAEVVLELPQRHENSDEGYGLIHPEDVEKHRALVEQAIAAGGSYISVYRHPHPGKVTWLEEHGRAVVDSAGKTVRLVGVVQNITARKQAEAALRHSEEKYAKSFRSSPAAIAISTIAEGRFTEVNDRFSEIFGYSCEEMIGHTSIELGFYPDPAERNEILRLLQENGRFQNYEIRMLNRYGEPRDLLFSGERIEIEGQDYLLALIMDITDRKQAEAAFARNAEALQESQSRFVEFVESVQDSYFTLDREWRITYANRRFAEVVGKDRSEMLGNNFWEVFPEYQRQEVAQHYHKVMMERVPVHFRAGGIYSKRMFDISLYPTREGLASFSIDRTEELRYQQQLEGERARLDTILQSLPVGVWIADADGKLLGKNEQADQIWAGQAPLVESVDQYPVYRAWDVETGRKLAPEEYPVAVALHTEQRMEKKELRIQRLDGSEGYVLVSAAPVQDSEGRLLGAVGINLDITDRKRAEAALRANAEALRAYAEALKANTEALQSALERAEHGRLLLEALMDNVPEGVSITGGPPDFRLERISSYGLNLTKNPTNPELIGKRAGEHQDAWGIFLPDGKTRPTKEQMPLYRAGHFGELVENQEMLILRNDGTYVPVLVNAAPIRDDRGRIRGAINTWRDISERKQAEQKLKDAYARLRFFVDANIVGVTMYHEDGTLIEANDYYLNLIGYSREALEAGSLNWRSFTAAEYLPLDDQAIAVLKAGSLSPAYEKEYLRKDGSRVWIMVRRALLPDGIFAAFVVDITDRKQADKILAETAEKLARSNQELEAFAFIASHDLQEPLRKVVMFGSSLRQHLRGSIDETAENYLSRMQDAAGRMQAMINGLLDLSRVNTQGGELIPLNLNQVVAEVVEDLEARIQAARGQVIIDPLPQILGDAVQIRALFQNLIGNALKFHQADVPPIVRVTGTTQQTPGAPMVEIRVADNGIGFEQEYAQRIFQPFQRLHGRSDYEGTGLGLAICQKIVERHHGKIDVESAPGRGSTFILRLPSGF